MHIYIYHTSRVIAGTCKKSISVCQCVANLKRLYSSILVCLSDAKQASAQLVWQEHGCGFQWLRPTRGLSFIRGVSGETLHDGKPVARGIQNHAEVHMRINWAMGAWDNRMRLVLWPTRLYCSLLAKMGRYWEEKMRNKPEQLKQMQDHYPESFCKLLSPLRLGKALPCRDRIEAARYSCAHLGHRPCGRCAQLPVPAGHGKYHLLRCLQPPLSTGRGAA